MSSTSLLWTLKWNNGGDDEVDDDKLYCGMVDWLFYDEGRYHIGTSPLICRVNQWTGFFMIGTSVMKELTIIGWALFPTRTIGGGLIPANFWYSVSRIQTLCQILVQVLLNEVCGCEKH